MSELQDFKNSSTDADADDGDDDSPPLLAELDEERKATLQIDEVRMRTVEPGLMKLPVNRVSTTEDSNTVTIEVEHPIEGEQSFHLSKPSTWDPENELVEFLDYYNLTFSDVYALQTRHVYVDCSADVTRDWFLTRPPDEAPSRRERWAAGIKSAVGEMRDDIVESDARGYISLAIVALYSGLFPAFMFQWGLVAEPNAPSASEAFIGIVALAGLSVMLTFMVVMLAGIVAGDFE